MYLAAMAHNSADDKTLVYVVPFCTFLFRNSCNGVLPHSVLHFPRLRIGPIDACPVFFSQPDLLPRPSVDRAGFYTDFLAIGECSPFFWWVGANAPKTLRSISRGDLDQGMYQCHLGERGGHPQKGKGVNVSLLMRSVRMSIDRAQSSEASVDISVIYRSVNNGYSWLFF